MGIATVTAFVVSGAAVTGLWAARELALRKSSPRDLAVYGSCTLTIAIVYLFYVAGWAAISGGADSRTFLPSVLDSRGRRGILWAYTACAGGFALLAVSGLGYLRGDRR